MFSYVLKRPVSHRNISKILMWISCSSIQIMSCTYWILFDFYYIDGKQLKSVTNILHLLLCSTEVIQVWWHEGEQMMNEYSFLIVIPLGIAGLPNGACVWLWSRFDVLTREWPLDNLIFVIICVHTVSPELCDPAGAHRAVFHRDPWVCDRHVGVSRPFGGPGVVGILKAGLRWQSARSWALQQGAEVGVRGAQRRRSCGAEECLERHRLLKDIVHLLLDVCLIEGDVGVMWLQ